MTSTIQHKENPPAKKHLKIQFLFFPGCPNHNSAWRELTDVLAYHELEAIVERIIVENADDARRLGFLGSPTLKIDGVDVEPSARQRTDFGMTCRVYRVGGRVLGAPPREMIEQALAATPA